jgi:hypothetical protein
MPPATAPTTPALKTNHSQVGGVHTCGAPGWDNEHELSSAGELSRNVTTTVSTIATRPHSTATPAIATPRETLPNCSTLPV